MNNKVKMAISVLASIVGSIASVSSVFAANPYGIQYEGGEILGPDNVQIDEGLLTTISPLVKYTSNNTIGFSDSTLWNNGHISVGKDSSGNQRCREGKYIKVKKSDLINSDSNLWFSISNDSYKIRAQINKITLDDKNNYLADDDEIIVVVFGRYANIGAGYRLYEDSACEVVDSTMKTASISSGLDIYVELNVKLYKNTNDSVLHSNNLYFGLTDIDAGQSFKILNSNNLLSRDNMYAASAENLQPTDSDLRNRFVSSGHYIYSEYDTTIFDTPDIANIFVKENPDVLEDGLDVVFGYVTSAAFGLQYYTKQFIVKYVSDEKGTISGIKEESIISDDTPSGSTSKGNDGYEFVNWIANVDVVLEDGTIIEAGQPIAPDQIRRVIIGEDVTFTAVHEEVIAVPDTGVYTEETNAMLASVSILGIVLGSLGFSIIPRLFRKKIGFKK